MDQLQQTNSSSSVQLILPPVYAINQLWKGNLIQQLLHPATAFDGRITVYKDGKVKGFIHTPVHDTDKPILLMVNNAKPPEGFTKILRAQHCLFEDERLTTIDLSTAKWVRHPYLSRIPSSPVDFERTIAETIESWEGAFNYQAENLDKGIQGLRLPQIGAIHAIHAHWTVTDEAATVVMPTGTGKTETMLSILVSAQCARILVVVPTDALRTQIFDKFLTLGILKEIGVVPDSVRYPIVGLLKRKPKDCSQVDEFFARCQVIVTTMSIAGRSGVGKEVRLKMEADGENHGQGPNSTIAPSQWQEEIQARMADHCPFLFVDEAHHIAANTWTNFKQQFESKRVLQFTATPFRNDEKPVGGKIVFNYPMRKAQQEGYFKPIRFIPVEEFDLSQADAAIAAKAVEQLRADWEKGYKHILMARAETIDRAESVYRQYQKYKEFNPVRIHSGMKASDRTAARQQIMNGDARIVVCVDMLGEGFDLPALKIAAFHDVRKSLAVTLQLAGRFTRTKSTLGEPTFVANIADVNVQEKLSNLYAQDADWNALLRRSSEFAIQEQVDLYDYIDGFKNLPKELPLQNIRPPMKVVIYQTECQEWIPEQFTKGIQGCGSLEKLVHDINADRDTLIAVLAWKVPLDWAKIEGIYNWHWELYVLYWDKSQNLLYIAGSHSGGHCKKLADAVAGFSFQVGLEYEDDLSRKSLSPGFRQAFQEQNIRLSPDDSIDIKKKEKEAKENEIIDKEAKTQWEIFDKDRNRTYLVTKRAKGLNIRATVKPVYGQPVFRSFYGINRLIFHNVGLTTPYGGFIRYIMRAGSNVWAALSTGDRSKAYESNLAGAGFENRERTSLGCSRSGKIWSLRSVNLQKLSRWFQEIGSKVMDERINLDNILEGTLKPVEITSRPLKMPVTIEWPKVVIIEPETATRFVFPPEQLFRIKLKPIDDLVPGPITDHLRQVLLSKEIQLSNHAEISDETDGKRWYILDPGEDPAYYLDATDQASDLFDLFRANVTEQLTNMEIRLKSASEDGNLLFEVLSEERSVTLEQTFFDGFRFNRVDGPSIQVKRGYLEFQLIDFFDQYPPLIRFADGSFLEGNTYVPLEVDFEPYPIHKIQAWEWVGTDICSESQGAGKKADSIQYRVVQELKNKDYDLIYDDDGSGEAADVVAVRFDKQIERIVVDFYHCKFSSEKTAGGRIKDLYEVCGQAQKSLHWFEHSAELFQHLQRREPRKKDRISRIDKGDLAILRKYSEMSKTCQVDIRIFIVQPGFAIKQASVDQLRLLSVTEKYLMDTFQVPFCVIASSYLGKVETQGTNFLTDLKRNHLSEDFRQALNKKGGQLSNVATVRYQGEAAAIRLHDQETGQVILAEVMPDGINLYECPHNEQELPETAEWLG